MYRFLLTPRWLAMLAAVLAAAAVMVLLGNWQLDRYHERSAINERIESAELVRAVRLDDVLAPPAAGAAAGPGPAADAEWIMATAAGRFDADHEVLVRGRTVHGRVGFEVVTPLVLPDGTAVLVDRGWVPPHPDGTAVRPDVPPPPPGEVTVVGRVQRGESGGRGVDRVDGDLHTRRVDPDAIAAELPYPLRGGYLLLVEPDDPGLTPIPVRRENAWLNGGYAVQWWIFAAMVLVGYGWFARRDAHRLRQPAAAAAPERENRSR